MVDAATVRRLALALPDVIDASQGDRLAFEIAGGKGFAWTYLLRLDPKKPRVADPSVLAVRCQIERKEMLIAAAPDRFFDDHHYRSYAAVLIRLAAMDAAELGEVLRGGWRLAAPKPLLKSHPDV